MKGGYFQGAKVKIRLKEGLIIQKYTLQLFDNRKGDGSSLNWKGKVLFFVTAKAQKKLRSKFFQFG